jgi:integrase
LIETYEARTKANADIRAATVTAHLGAVKRIRKTWPDLELLEPKQITPAAVFAWATRFKTEGTKFQPPGTKAPRRGNSATAVNSAIDALRAILDLAVERGQIHTNPVLVKPPSGRLKKKVLAKKLALPSMAQIERLFAALEDNGAPGGWGMEAADLCRFLTYSGARIGEVPLVTWECVDWERCQLRISGYKTTTSDRFVPLFPALEGLLKKIIDRRKSAARFAPDGKAFLAPTDPILRLRECQKSIDTACLRAKVQRMTHHDFRHLFATVCIESGVDIPTVSAWLGHNDGGVLAMKTYGHLRREHSQSAAAKVNFTRS